MKHRGCLTCLGLFLVLIVRVHATGDIGLATAGQPLVRAIDSAEIPTKGAVLAYAFTPDGTRVVGSNELSVFDGQRWELIDVPGAYAFRALAAISPNRVYVGALGAIGYLERDGTGRWGFVSLQPELARAGVQNAGDIWLAQVTGGSVVFVTSTAILRLAPAHDGVTGGFEVWPLTAALPLQAAALGDRVLVYQAGQGLLQIGEHGAPALLYSEAALPAKPLAWAVEASPTRLIGLGNDAFRELSEGKLKRMDMLSDAIRDSVPTGAVRIDDTRIAIGTLKRGIVIATVDGRVLGICDGASGLVDDAIQTLAVDAQGLLWAGTNAGPAQIASPGLAGLFDQRHGLGPGLPRKVLAHVGGALALTSKGLYPLGNQPRVMPLSAQAVLWDAAIIDGQLWVAGFNGLWRNDSSGWTRELSVPTDIFRISPTRQYPDSVLVMLGDASTLLVPSPHGGWAERDLGAKVNDTPVSLLEEPGIGTTGPRVWISTILGLINGYEWAGQESHPLLRLKAHYHPGVGLPQTARHPELHLVGGLLVAFTETGILALNPERTAFEPVAGLEELVGVAATEDSPGTAYWLVKSRNLGGQGSASLLRVHVSQGRVKAEPFVAQGIESAGTPASLDWISDEQGPALWIGGSRGFVRIDPQALAAAPAPPAVRFTRVETTKGRLALSPASGTTLPPGTGPLEFDFGAEAPAGEPLLFQTRLDGVDEEWTAPLSEQSRSLSGVRPGDYTLQVRAVDRWSRNGPAARYGFTLEAPWYLRPFALIGYAVVGIVLVAGLVRWRMARLRWQNEKLNRLVAERTRELELASTAKSEFLENISHELRNPMNGLLGMLGLLREERLAPPEREATRTLKDCARQMAHAFEDVLGFSKLEYGYVVVEKKPFGLRTVLAEVIALHAATAEQAGCELRLDYPSVEPEAFVGDAAKVKTIVSNFISNAIKYAPGHPVRITVATDQPPDGPLTVIIEVKDEGAGIPAEEQELIFQKFVRGREAKRAQIPGTGIGLAMCRVLARHLGGSVGVVSSPGQGSVFYLRVPLGLAAEGATVVPSLEVAANCQAGEHLALVVEDEAYNRAVLRGLAEELGYRTRVAADSTEAFAVLDQTEVALVFLDWALPGLKGTDIARLMRRRPGGERLVIIATTAHDSDEMRARCREAGMDAFLLKPYDEAAVRATIAEAWARRRSGADDETVMPAPTRVASDPTPQHADLNLRAFKLYARGEETVPAEALVEYLRALSDEFTALEEAEAQGNLPAATEHAHRLASLSGLINAQELNQAARKLQTADKSLRPEERGRLLRTVAVELATLSQRLHGISAAPVRK